MPENLQEMSLLTLYGSSSAPQNHAKITGVKSLENISLETPRMSVMKNEDLNTALENDNLAETRSKVWDSSETRWKVRDSLLSKFDTSPDTLDTDNQSVTPYLDTPAYVGYGALELPKLNGNTVKMQYDEAVAKGKDDWRFQGSKLYNEITSVGLSAGMYLTDFKKVLL